MEFIKVKENLYLYSAEDKIYLQNAFQQYDITDCDCSQYLLPLLESDKAKFLQAAAAATFNKDRLCRITDQLLCFPFINRMDRWSARALDWMDETDQDRLRPWARQADISWMPPGLRSRFLQQFGIADHVEYTGKAIP